MKTISNKIDLPFRILTIVSTMSKQEFTEIMHQVFGMIEELDIQEGKYLEFAELFKQMNINLDKLVAIKQQVSQNRYYQRFIRERQTLKRQMITEAEKKNSIAYRLCDCGRYIQKSCFAQHLQTLVHFQGRRNRKYAGRGLPDVVIHDYIEREITLTAITMKHIEKFNEA